MEAIRQELEARFGEMDDERLLAEATRRHHLTPEAREILVGLVLERNLPVPAVHSDEAADQRQAAAWVTVERFRDLSAAIVARSALEAAEIPCFLRDENTVRMDWQISNFIGGMRLQVPAMEEDAARDVLRGLALPAEDEIHLPLEALPEDCCPRCGSADISRARSHRGRALMALWLFALPVPRGQVMWHCAKCGNEWPDEDSEPNPAARQ